MQLPNGRSIISAVVYISPNQEIADIIEFIHHVLLPYTPVGSAELGKEYHLMPMILSGDFNVNFATDTAEPLVQFLKNKLQLTMNTNKNVHTTRQDTTIDAVFQRYLNSLESVMFVSYFSYHKPIVSSLKYIENAAENGAENAFQNDTKNVVVEESV